MNKALHFAWWLTVPGSDESPVQLYATGASEVVKVEAWASGRRFAPFFSSQPNPSMPPVLWWNAKRELYTARITFTDGSVVEPAPLDMRTDLWPLRLDAPPAEHRAHTRYMGRAFTAPLTAKEGWNGPELDLWVDHCAFNGGGPASVEAWFPGWRRVYVTDCSFTNCAGGPQGTNVELVRGCVLRDIGNDALSNALVVWGASIVGHVKGRADFHPDTYSFNGRGPQAQAKLLAGIRDFSNGSQGIFADRSTLVRNAAIVQCHIATDGVGAALSLENSVENILIDSCRFDGPRFITSSRTNVVIRKSPGVS